MYCPGKKEVMELGGIKNQVEAPFFGKNVQSMLKLGRAQGVAMAAKSLNGFLSGKRHKFIHTLLEFGS